MLYRLVKNVQENPSLVTLRGNWMQKVEVSACG